MDRSPHQSPLLTAHPAGLTRQRLLSNDKLLWEISAGQTELLASCSVTPCLYSQPGVCIGMHARVAVPQGKEAALNTNK